MFEIHGGFDSIVASTRVRLARNLKGYPYRPQPPEALRDIAEQVERALKSAAVLAEEFSRTEVQPQTEGAQAMVERHLISPALAARGGWIIASRSGGASILIGEEDHIRLQVMGSGLCPKECLAEAQHLAQLLESQLPMDYDERLGYLTACPTNLGTGLRVSVMLHLPMLAQLGGMQEFIGWAGGQGCAVRGAFGEGTAALGHFYQVSNQVTLGRSEETLAEGLVEVCTRIIEAEQRARQTVRERDEIGLIDRLCRAAGVLQSARRMSTQEATESLSDVLIGLQQGILQGVTPREIHAAARAIRPATLAQRTANAHTSAERDAARADYLRQEIGSRLKAI